MGVTTYYIVLVAAIPFGYFVVRLGSSLLLFDLPFTQRLGRRGIHLRPGRAFGITLAVSLVLLLLLGGAIAALMLLARREEPVLTMFLGAGMHVLEKSRPHCDAQDAPSLHPPQSSAARPGSAGGLHRILHR